MSKYTTGEIAKLCGVSVRTVQYYDTRNLLVPSELSEGGRRLYSDEDLSRMKIICFLREIGLPINSICQLLKEEHPEEVISILLDQQEKEVKAEIAEQQKQLQLLEQLSREVKKTENFSVKSIGDIAYKMENKKKLWKVRKTMIAVGIGIEAIEIGTFVFGITKGIWWPFAIGICVTIALAIWISVYYFKHTAYICPKCHTVFKPSFKEAFFANHTPNTRKLKCKNCGHKGFCVETYDENV